jgi:creatinine amidohydrolase
MVLTATPLALLGNPHLLDHAGRWEASQMLALRPELVDLHALGEGALPPAAESAVLGDDPRQASADQGEALLERALAAWSGWMELLLATRDPAPLYQLYGERREAYREYVQRYYQGSWEEAIQAWWRERTG